MIEAGTVFVLKERERREKESDEEMKDDFQALVLNGDSQQLSSSRFSSLLASKDRDYLLSPTGAQVKICDLDGNIIGLYFGANWYPPCQNFTQALIGIYDQLKSCGCNFEIVYVSSDEDADAFNNYHACMRWLAIPFSDLETKKALNRKFDVEGIPCLVILQPNDNKDDETLRDGVELIHRYGVRAFPFTKERLQRLHEEEREKHEKQTLTSLLTNHDKDYLLGHPRPKQRCHPTCVGFIYLDICPHVPLFGSFLALSIHVAHSK